MENQISVFQKIEKVVTRKIKEAPTQFKKMVHGFLIEPTEKTASRVDECLTKMLKFNTYLSEKGLQPLAILPYEVWKNVCQKASLLRFEHLSQECITHTDMHIPEEIYSGVAAEVKQEIACYKLKCYSIFFGILLPLLGLAVNGVVNSLDYYHEHSDTALVVTLGFICGLGICAKIISVIMESTYDKRKELTEAKRNLIRKDYQPSVEEYFPEGTDKKEWEKVDGTFLGNKGGKNTVKVSFKPQPTSLFESVLKHMVERGIPIMVAADAKAIAVEYIGISKNYTQHLLDEQEAERKRIAAMNADPILYTTSKKGNLVAILAHYGDFPCEELVMDYIRNEYSVINLVS